MTSPAIRLTQYSHGAGCGCKISPKVLETILHSEREKFVDPRLLVGNETRDDAAVYDIGNGVGIISTTDFFHADRRRSVRFRPHCGSQRHQRRVCDGRQTDHGDRHSRLADRQAAAGGGAAGDRRRPFRLPAGGDRAGRRPFHRCAGTYFRPGGHRRGQYRAGEEKQRGTGRGETLSDQAAGHRRAHDRRETKQTAH